MLKIAVGDFKRQSNCFLLVFITGVPAIVTGIEVVREDRAFETDVDAESILHMCHVSIFSLLCKD